jgi:uncharacterized protein (DUF2141 family)
VKKSLLVCILIAVCSCARQGLPPGGPPDVTPPKVLCSSPDSGEVRVTRVDEICIDFSERMAKRSVRDAIFIRPVVQVREGRWYKNTFCLVLDDSLEPAVTYSVLVMGGCQDSHNNYMKSPGLIAFSTGDTLMGGVIEGSVLSKGLPASGIPVWAFDSLKSPEPDFAAAEPDYVSQSGAAGDFKFIGLPSGHYLLFAFKDKDANRAYDEEADFLSAAPAAVHVTPEAPEVLGVEIALVDPDEPGTISGIIMHCLPESVSVVVTAVSMEDSLESHSASMMRDSTYAVTGLPPARYSVRCFADLNLNRMHEPPGEPICDDIHYVQVPPGETVKNVTFVMPCPEETSGEDKEPAPEKPSELEGAEGREDESAEAEPHGERASEEGNREPMKDQEQKRDEGQDE